MGPVHPGTLRRRRGPLVRIAAAALREGRGGYPEQAPALLKSPPGTAI